MQTRVLLAVDKLKSTQTGLGKLLCAHLVDCEVVVALTGEPMLSTAREWSPNVVLIDAEMSDLDGLKVCESLRALEQTATVPIVFAVSRITPVETRVRWLEAGADDLISKPINAAEAVAKVKMLLRMKNALRESEERYGRMLAAVTTYCYRVHVANGQAVSTEHGAGCTAVTGYAPEDYTHDPGLWLSMVHPDDRQGVLAHVAEVLRGEKTPFIEHRILHRDGSVRWVRDTIVSSYDPEGELLLYDGLVEDITDRKGAEEALRESERQYRLLAEGATDMIVRCGTDGTFLYVSPASQTLFGHDPEELLGRNAFEFIHPDDAAAFGASLECGGTREGAAQLRYRWRRGNGQYAWVETTSRGVRDLDAGTVREVIAIVRDVTERKAIEEELGRYRDQLEELVAERTVELQKANDQLEAEIEERKRTEQDLAIRDAGVESSISPIAFADLQGAVTYVNTSFLSLWGYDTKKEVVGKHAFSFWESVADARKVYHALRQDGRWMGELVAKKKDGSSLNLLLAANMVADNSGAPIQMMVSLLDTTAIKRLQAQLVRSERLAATGQLATSIAHEINSPLQAIAVLLSGLRRKCREDGQADLDLLMAAFRSIRNTVRNLLDLNRPERARKRPTDLNAVITGTVSLMEAYLKQNKIALDLNLSRRLPMVTASPQLLSQVILNLINNAAEAILSTRAAAVQNPASAVRGRIAIHSNLMRNEAIITVSDTGSGISEEDVQHVFDPFFTGKRKMGMGFGLSICDSIIADHNGTIRAGNAPDGGAVFTIALPLKKPDVSVGEHP